MWTSRPSACDPSTRDYSVRWNFMKFRIAVPSNRTFRESPYREERSLPECVNKILPFLLHFSSDLDKILYRSRLQKNVELI
jgi:hypothetical protein